MVKNSLKEKVPEENQKTPEFNIFLKEISEKKFVDVKAVKMYVDAELKLCKDEFEKTNNETSRRHRPSIARRIEFLKLVKEKILYYL